MFEHRTPWVIGGVVAALLGGAAWWWMFGGYGHVSEPGYQYALALYSACHRQDAAKVQQIVEMLDQSQRQGELPSRDVRWLRRIARRALAGQWQTASHSIRQLMEDQVQAAAPLPALDP